MLPRRQGVRPSARPTTLRHGPCSRSRVKEAQAIEDRLIKAARGEDDLDAIGTELNERDFDFEEWEILYRLLLQVRLHVSATGTDALETATEPKPALRERVAAVVRVLAGQSNGH